MLGDLVSAGINAWQGSENREAQERIAAQNIAAQREFAQHGISWKVEDAKRAGLHPLAAIGASTSSFSPVSVGDRGAEQFGQMGQDLGRAIKSALSGEDRAAMDENKLRKLQIDKAGLENDILRTDLASRVRRENQQIGPQMPIGAVLPRGWAAMTSGSRSPDRSSGIATDSENEKVKDVAGPGYKRQNLWGVYPYELNPDISTGESLENVGGEYAGGVLAAPNIPAHIFYDFKKNKWPVIQNYLSRLDRWGRSRSMYRSLRGGD